MFIRLTKKIIGLLIYVGIFHEEDKAAFVSVRVFFCTSGKKNPPIAFSGGLRFSIFKRAQHFSHFHLK